MACGFFVHEGTFRQPSGRASGLPEPPLIVAGHLGSEDPTTRFLQFRNVLSSARAFGLTFFTMKKFAAIVILAVLLGTMYGYVLGRIAGHPPQSPPPDPWLAPEYPAFLLQGDFWGQLIFWSALPLCLLFAWLLITYVGETWLREQKARAQDGLIEDVQDLFKEASSLASRGRGQSPESSG